jgi:hypothetical protein
LVDKAVGSDVHMAAADLLKSLSHVQMQTWSQSTAMDWANESFKISESAQTKYCESQAQSCEPLPGTVAIDDAYIRANVPIVRERLLKAGVRLAHLLDQAFQKN